MKKKLKRGRLQYDLANILALAVFILEASPGFQTDGDPLGKGAYKVRDAAAGFIQGPARQAY